MISHIQISDFAIIENLSIDFHKGLNIITGETGAGKSIIIEAISLALGSRADTTYIRTGKDKAVIQILFTDLPEHTKYPLNDFGIDPRDDLVITREISSNGKSISKINGRIITVSELNKICRNLADIHGQYDHQSLLNPDNHISFIDKFGGQDLSDLLNDTTENYKE